MGIQIERSGEVAVVTIANPPVNSVSGEIAAGLSAAMDQITADRSLDAVVVMGAGQTFIAGADLRMLSLVVEGKMVLPDLNSFLFKLENSPKPVVIAIQGAALGGGLETAMAGHYRLMSPDAKAGQPEVKLGLIPGMGGTQRLPRLVGAKRALEMCVGGEPIDAGDALRCGLVDRVVEGDLRAEAIAFARTVKGLPRPTSHRSCEPSPLLFQEWRTRAAGWKRGQHAPSLAVDAIEAAVSKPFAEGFAYEQELFRHCLASQEARALLYVFFGERTVAKIPNLGTDVIPHKIKRAAVVGAGFMGTGIAMTLANAGIAVLLTDASEQALGNARENVGSYYRRAAERGRITPPEAEKRIGLITIRAGLDGLEFADLVIEAVFENLQVKQLAFHQIARVASKGCILATNTSTLNVDEIAAVTGRPEMVVGLHFFSPAHVMKLLEVVRGKHTSDDVIVSAMALGKELGKVAVPARNGFGFIGNRMVLPYLAEAHACLEDGASVEQINQALYDFGMPMGPLAMEDMVGLDVSFYMRQEGLRRGYGAPSRLADALYYAGHYGQKTGAGWSLYDSARKPLPNPEILRLVGEGVKRNFSDHEIVDRCIGALVAEGHKVLDEGIAQRAVDIDMVYVHGYGFPAWRGGPMFFSANSIK